MSNPTPLTPTSVIASDDPGDETARRYRYQWTYAAIVCCMLIDPIEGTVEVYCEHHEDILLKFTDGLFSGIQVKTRGSDQPLWTTADDGVTKSCKRFVELERRFPDIFREFKFLTNHPFQSSKNVRDFVYVLSKIREAEELDGLDRDVKKFVEKIAKELKCDGDVVFKTLSKTTASSDLPKLPDAELRLVDTITRVWSRASECSLQLVRRAARELIQECERASSLAHQEELLGFISASRTTGDAELVPIIEGKRITLERILKILENGLIATAPLYGHLDGDEPGAGKTDLLEEKLDTGGFSAVSQFSAADLRNKADYLGIKWTQMHGREEGLQRYGHIKSLVLRDAARSFEAVKSKGDPFGKEMLDELQARLKGRRADGTELYDCSEDHLEGFAYSLTAECKVRWSMATPWEAK